MKSSFVVCVLVLLILCTCATALNRAKAVWLPQVCYMCCECVVCVCVCMSVLCVRQWKKEESVMLLSMMMMCLGRCDLRSHPYL